MNLVLLQGPLGPFFQTLGNQLIDDGHTVYKFCFNGGDECWSTKAQLVRFQQPLKYWRDFFAEFCQAHQIDAVVVYGDCRAYHQVAAKVCRSAGIAFWALEEGYLRPDFITMELGGVNANSPLFPLRSNLASYRPSHEYQYQVIVGKSFASRAWYATRYHVNKLLGRVRYRHFVDHRPWTIVEETKGWLKSGWIKITHKQRDAALLQALKAHKGRIFLLPLQVSEDFQIRHHSNFNDVATVIEEVIRSFARYAKPQDRLLIKHHPMDRGYVDYGPQINRLKADLGLETRVDYGYMLPLPKIYPLLKGVVTVNSTVGFSALLHKVPVKCLGKALYDIPGLTSSQPLSKFWQQQSPVDMKVFSAVRTAFLHETQVNGCFYKGMQSTAKQISSRMAQKQQEKAVSAAS
ncbi:capsular biosynthesis protein [Shewanella sp. JM162201]|uniref:Capsular biosynthesis protein n=1 Tax=Shewanella jiangmenensis TaxID=2837387 RepID=A0ABS5V4G5_9GAMM|nr:capsular biosynthesis protein [Shewanella jiangmenensis]MBT1445360.1 capsular biosynthesis protein [Shewanella jiangmenensis]